MLDGWVVWPVGVFVAVAVALLGRRRGWSLRRRLVGALFTLYVTWIVSMTLFPLPLDAHLPQKLHPEWYPFANLVPLHTIRRMLQTYVGWTTIRQIGGNVLVFVPFGLLMPLLWRRLWSLAAIAATGLAVSLTIELLQLLVSHLVGYAYRVFDVDDLLLNTVGVVLGYALLRVYRTPPTRAAHT